MRTHIRSFLAGVVAIAAVVGAVGLASANTELVPASRLVVPFFDISSGRDTFLVLTNASRNIRLDATTFACGAGLAGTCGPYGVHLEYYGQSCQRVDESTFLTPGDIDQFDLALDAVVAGASGTGGALGPVTASSTQSGLGGRGWVDIDVRFTQGGIVQTSDPSVQANVLLGTVVITDSANDFALAYPMASSIGTSNIGGGVLGRIVRRNQDGRAIAWSGRYEPFPPRTFVPAFFAEGTDTSGPNAGTAFTAFLAMAGPADGNWDNSGNGEAPGQQIGAPGAAGEPLISVTAIIFDGCEHSISQPFSSHYVDNFLSKLFPSLPARTSWTAAKCTSLPGFPGRDELSVSQDPTGTGQAVGWIDLPNSAIACDNTTAGATAANCPAYSGASTTTTFQGAGNGTGQRRGVVGVLIENVVNTALKLELGDVTRLWGDCTPWQGRVGLGAFPGFALCEANTEAGARCTCSLVDFVSHQDIAQQGDPSTFVPVAGQLP